MAIFFKPDEYEIISQAYDALPEPKPSKDDFYTYVFEQKGIENVKAQDPAHVIRAAKGATDAREQRKHFR